MRPFVLIALMAISHASFALDCGALYGSQHLTVSQDQLKTGFTLRQFPSGMAKKILHNYNHSTEGCGLPADNIVAVYSPYAAGSVLFRCGNNVVSQHTVDRVQLHDALTGKVAVPLDAPHVEVCAARSTYLPTMPTLEMPTSPNP